MSGQLPKRNTSKSGRSRPKKTDSSSKSQQSKVYAEDEVSGDVPSNGVKLQRDNPNEPAKYDDPTEVNLAEQGVSIFPLHLLERKDIVRLNLCHNNLHIIPVEIKNLVALTHLDISQNPILCFHANDFFGIPFEISFLQNLRFLKISQCNLRYIPPAIWKCRRLCELDISHNKINVLPPEVGSLTKLCRLSVQYTSVTTLPAEIAYCQELEEILMWGNIIENLPDVLRYLPKLRSVAVNFRSFTSVIDNYMEGLLKRGLIKSEHLPAVIFEISGLNQLNLESTKINQLPAKCVCKLQELILANNYFQIIPKLVMTLDQLSFLDLSGNMIKSIPGEIEILTNLKRLWLNKNEIACLPHNIGSLTLLEELSLSQNLLTTFPATIGKLRVLRTLIADKNRITSLPDTIGDLHELETLDLTENLLEVLPAAMLNMKKIQSAHHYHKFQKHGLWLHKNPLSIPPQTIWKTNNPAKIYDYLKDCQVEKIENSQRQKLIVLGGKQIGKTSLIRSITAGKSCLTNTAVDGTKIVEFSTWMTKNDVKILIQDTQGDEFFRKVVSPYYFDETAFYLIIFNADGYTENSYHTMVGCWIDMLLLYCPQAVIKVVGTHIDLCCQATANYVSENVWNCIKNQLNSHKEKLKSEILIADKEIKDELTDSIELRRKLRTQKIRLTNATENSLQILQGISLVSSSESLQGVPELIAEVERTFLDSALFPTVRQTVNQKWHKFRQAMKTSPGYYIKWKYVVKLATECEISGKELPKCLTHLKSTGKILWYRQVYGPNTVVIHRPRKLVEIMRTVFRQDMSDYLNFEHNRIFISLGQFNEETFARAKQNLLTRGQMPKSLLQCLCLCFPSNKDKTDIITFSNILKKFNLCYIVPQPDIPPKTREAVPYLVIPSYCQLKWENETDFLWPDGPTENQIELEAFYTFPTIKPVMLFSRLSCQIHFLFEYRYDWSNVIVGKIKNTSTRLKRDADENIDITVRGSKEYEVQAVLAKIEALMENVISFSSGLTYRMQRRIQKQQQ